MRHLKAGRKLNRSSAHRRALLRNLVTSLLQHEHLQTTDAKAKEMRSWVDRMITLGKRGDLHLPCASIFTLPPTLFNVSRLRRITHTSPG